MKRNLGWYYLQEGRNFLNRNNQMSGTLLTSFKKDKHRGSNINRSTFCLSFSHTHKDGFQSEKWIEMDLRGARVHTGKTN